MCHYKSVARSRWLARHVNKLAGARWINYWLFNVALSGRTHVTTIVFAFLYSISFKLEEQYRD